MSTEPSDTSERPRTARRPIASGALALLATLLPTAAAALEFECSVPGDTRFLRVDIPGEEHLCEVSVTADGGTGERRVLWYADNETLFCSAKAYELRDKYERQWTFDCSRWPDRDGIDLLSARHRSILDAELKAQLRGERSDGVSGVRAVASTPLEDDAGVLALQFLGTDGSDRVRLVADEIDRWTVIGEARDLAARIDPLPGLRLRDAFVASVSPSGALEVLTLLEPESAGSNGAGAAAPRCEGRQTLRASASGALVPSTPHRHVCAIGAAPADPG